ncbi:MAG: hypothetical protein IKF38_01105 [Clostridia bacterium]|nr:hypothetical protein [Clostridia bacterium]
MKKFKKSAYIFLITVIAVLVFTIYTSLAKETATDQRDKAFSEIQFLESKIIYMFNSLNNIEFENYKISTEDISEKSKKSSQSTSSAGNGSDSSSQEGSKGAEESSTGGEESSGAGGSSTSLEETKKYTLNMKGILASQKEVNWDYMKNETELLENCISSMTLDLYEISLNNVDILNFNKEYDNLLIAVKNEDKENSLKELSILYSYIPKFIKNCNKDEQYEVIVNTKLNIFNAYAILDSEDWESMGKYIQDANNVFSKLLTDVNIKNKNQYTINKCYITLNGLQTATEIKDKEIFLIKYRNLLEDLNNI